MSRVVILIVAAGLSALLYLDLCNLIYQCGCKSLWNGAAEACNIHQAGVPHCPWCSYGKLGYLPWLLVFTVQLGLAFLPKKLATKWRALWSFLAFPVVAGLSALVFGLISGYWSG